MGIFKKRTPLEKTVAKQLKEIEKQCKTLDSCKQKVLGGKYNVDNTIQ